MPGKLQLLYLLLGDRLPFRVCLVQQPGLHLQTRDRGGSANVLQYGLITLERTALPVFADLGKQPMLDGIPFGSFTCSSA